MALKSVKKRQSSQPSTTGLVPHAIAASRTYVITAVSWGSQAGAAVYLMP